jgi:uncharacterized Fe-S center protein
MAKPVVYFFDDASRLREGASKFFEIVSKDFGKGKVGLKVHFGETGSKTFVKAEWLTGAKTFFPEAVFVECNVLYRGHRTLRKNHIATAQKHGFGFLPIDILDGDHGESQVEIPVNVGRTGNAKIGAGLLNYGKLIAVSHFKGHMATGFGGALKNVGMGLGSRAGKMDMHSAISPYVKPDKCISCGTCVRECPADAISMDKTAVIDVKKCIGCAHCIAACPQGAIDLNWNMSHEVNNALMEKIAEYSSAVMKERRWWFMNFITDLTYDCDCFGIEQKVFMPDIGVALSQDPVALDKASLDLVKEKNNGIDPFLKKHGVDGSHILRYAEKIGLGKTDYELARI